MSVPSIAHVNTTVYTGGAARTVALLAGVLNSSEQVRCEVIIGRGPASPEHNVRSLDPGRLGTALNVLAFRTLGLEAPISHSKWTDFSTTLQKFDLVHLHNAHGYYLPNDALQRLLAKQCVWTLHDYWLATGRRCFPDAVSPVGFTVSRTLPYVGWGYPAELIDRSEQRRERLRSMIDRAKPAFITPTLDMSVRLRKMGLDDIDVTVIPHGIFADTRASAIVDRDEARRTLGISNSEFVVLFAAAQVDHPLKGFKCLAQALKLLSGASVRLHVVGGRYRKAERLTGASAVFHGPVNPAKMELLMAACDVFVSPSHDETFGLTVVEALGQGTLVLCSDLPVLREVARGKAVHFPVGDYHALASNLDQMISQGHEPLEARTARAGAIRAHYSLEGWVNAHLDLYGRVLGSPIY